MNETKDGQLKGIKALLVVLIVTTAATAALVAVVMVQWAPVADYYKQMIAEEAAYEAEYGDMYDTGDVTTEEDTTILDENGNPVEEDVIDVEGEPVEEEDITLTDEDGNPIEEEIVVDEEGATDAEGSAGDEAASEGAAG
jgi:cytoskeletal protein RodZ